MISIYGWPSIAEYKTWSTYCSFWQFFLFFCLLMMSGTCTQKNYRYNPSGRQFSRILAGGVSMSSFRGPFSSVSLPKMETKTCRFGTISDLSTWSTSRRHFSKFIFVADKLILKISYSIYFDWFSTFSSIYYTTMETKTCRFGTMSDSATGSTYCRRFFKIRFRCRESPTL